MVTFVPFLGARISYKDTFGLLDLILNDVAYGYEYIQCIQTL